MIKYNIFVLVEKKNHFFLQLPEMEFTTDVTTFLCVYVLVCGVVGDEGLKV